MELFLLLLSHSMPVAPRASFSAAEPQGMRLVYVQYDLFSYELTGPAPSSCLHAVSGYTAFRSC